MNWGSVRPPNVVLVHWHDLGTRLNSYGCPDVSSPHLDALAADGLRFDHAYSTAPLCSPARASLFTGRYPARHGVTQLAHLGGRYAPGVATLPTMLRDVGYTSALVGLQHEATDSGALGFDEVLTPEGTCYCDPVADLAVDWLTRRAPGHDGTTPPFFLTVGMFETHRPYPADRYGPGDPANVAVPPYLPDNAAVRADLAAMAGAIEAADAATGRIIEAVDRSVNADNTMVIFTTDHGMAYPRAKSTLYDPGLHVALIVRPPRAWDVHARVVYDLTSHVDLVPTLMELAGAAPEATDGISFAATLRGDLERDRLREEIHGAKDFHEAYDPMRCVRTRRHKYIRNIAPGPAVFLPGDIRKSPVGAVLGDRHETPRPEEELYDLEKDPDEMVNLVGEPACEEVLDDMRRRLTRWLDATEDPVRDEQLWPVRS
jgi:arylsulfatase A-like enzyme